MPFCRAWWHGVWAGCNSSSSDDHAGLKAARQAIFGSILWQRCQFHLQQNAQAYVPRKELQAEVANDIRMIFNAPDRSTAEQYLAQNGAKVRQNRFPAGRLDGEEHP